MNDPTNPKWGADAVPVSSGITHIDTFTYPTLNYQAPLEAYSGPAGAADPTSTIYGSLPGRFEANILGVPGITVPMGFSSTGIPESLEFMGHFAGEGPLIGMAYDYEQHTHFRADPNLDALPDPGPALYQAVPVPEPPSVALGAIGFAAAGLADLVRRRHPRLAA